MNLTLNKFGSFEVSFTVNGVEFTDEFYPMTGMASVLLWGDGITVRPDTYTRRVTGIRR